MHELSVAQSILDTVLKERAARGLTNVSCVGVRIGVLSDVVPDALTFAFDAIRQESELADCRLAIESVPITLSCDVCGVTSVVEGVSFQCAACGSSSVRVDAGFELDIAYIEVPDTSPSETSNPECKQTHSHG